VFEQNKVNALKSCDKLLGTERIQQGIGSLLAPAFQGRIDTLFLKRGSQIWGTWNSDTGDIIELADHQPRFGDPDLLSETAVMTLEQGGQVFVLEEDEMPLTQACVGILRY
ncbi:MAG: hypothetical protein SCM11_18385, partial [Bacillota bacterium]|nr:hypothetical protein [Bacillota bacterium]